ncbi:MAG: cell division protein FtsZ [Hyphomicrobiales bacterium]|nr:cell division protein FtsZ [Hyphomicrobiales bacterium]
MSINLKVPDTKELKPRITVFGVGGAGGNAVNNMINSGLEGVDFVVANTDAQALAMSRCERRIQMGTAITEGLGAGSKPEIGAAAADETIDEIKSQLDGSHMVFITAGMGGGTGTGAAPVIAKTSFDQKILTVGVVTKPFQFEGQRRMLTADEGIKKLAKYVDTLLVIPNQNLFRVATEKTTFADAFSLADQVLHSGVACITDLMVKEGLINLDFADVKAVMAGMGKAMMGTGEASGDNRAIEAAEAAISNPLLDDVSMRGASGLLISITGGNDLTLYEVDEAASRIREEVDPEANIILGATFDKELDGQIRVSVVATGLDAQAAAVEKPEGGEADIVTSLTERISALKSPSDEKQDKTGAKPPAAVQPAAENDKAAAWKGSPDVTIEKRMPQPAGQKSAPGTGANKNPAEKTAFVPQPPSVAKKAPRRMPKAEEFPEIIQNELRAQSESKESDEKGIRAQKKKIGFFERLTGGRRNKEPEITRESEPQLDSAPKAKSKPKPVAAPAAKAPSPAAAGPAKVSKARLTRGAGTPKQTSAPVNVEADGEDLEIPAFLKRQAN